MNVGFFVYNFAKMYIPAVIILCMIYAGTTILPVMFTKHSPQVKKNIAPDNPVQKQAAIPQVVEIPRQVFNKNNQPHSTSKAHQDKPQYGYLVELKSGGSMIAKKVKVIDKTATLLVQKGYEVKISESDIIAIKRYKL